MRSSIPSRPRFMRRSTASSARSRRAAEDSFLKAVVAYHLIGEASIGRANQNFVAAQFDRVGSFPGLREAQRLAVRDEVRHIGIGVCYPRRRLTRDGARARALIEEIVEGFQALGDSLLEHAAPGLLDDFVGAYGAEPATLWAEVLHQLRLRLRSIGFSHVGRRAGCDREWGAIER